MATISHIHLEIKKLNKQRSQVSIKYQVCFSHCEVLAGSVFVENVTLRGDDSICDDHLITLRNDCIKAEKGCVSREISRMVSNRVLDEDPNVILCFLNICDRDEIYARVRLTSFTPSGSQGDSNIVRGCF